MDGTRLALCLALSGCAALSRPASPVPPGLALAATPIPFGVASPDVRSLYVVDAQGRLEAVDAATGATRWTTAAPTFPLLALDDAVIAVASGRVVVLRAASPAVTWSSDALPPEAGDHAREVHLDRRRLSGELWQVLPGTGMRACGERRLGTFSVDLDTGAVATVDDAARLWEAGGGGCGRWEPTVTAELRLEVRVDTAAITRGADGLEWAPRWLEAHDATTGALRWSRPAPPADFTPYE